MSNDDHNNSNFSNRFDRLEVNVQEIKHVLTRNTSSLEEHMRRTELVETRIEPLEKTHAVLNAIIKALPLLFAIPAAIYYLTKV